MTKRTINVKFITGVLCFAIVTACGCVSFNPATGEKELILIGSRQEIALGKTFAAHAAKKFKTVEDKEVVGRVQRIGAKVAENRWRQEIDYQFDVIEDDNVVNAFAFPGGYIFVTTGLLNKLKRDDEVAAVLAHEIAHVEARHSVKHLQSALLAQGLTAVVLTKEDDQAKKYAAMLAVTLTTMRFSRRHELQADSIGIKYVRKSGYDPRGMVNVLEVLAEQEKKGPNIPVILRTHPLSKERLKKAKSRAWVNASAEDNPPEEQPVD